MSVRKVNRGKKLWMNYMQHNKTIDKKYSRLLYNVCTAPFILNELLYNKVNK